MLFPEVRTLKFSGFGFGFGWETQHQPQTQKIRKIRNPIRIQTRKIQKIRNPIRIQTQKIQFFWMFKFFVLVFTWFSLSF